MMHRPIKLFKAKETSHILNFEAKTLNKYIERARFSLFLEYTLEIKPKFFTVKVFLSEITTSTLFHFSVTLIDFKFLTFDILPFVSSYIFYTFFMCFLLDNTAHK